MQITYTYLLELSISMASAQGECQSLPEFSLPSTQFRIFFKRKAGDTIVLIYLFSFSFLKEPSLVLLVVCSLKTTITCISSLGFSFLVCIPSMIMKWQCVESSSPDSYSIMGTIFKLVM